MRYTISQMPCAIVVSTIETGSLQEAFDRLIVQQTTQNYRRLQLSNDTELLAHSTVLCYNPDTQERQISVTDYRTKTCETYIVRPQIECDGIVLLDEQSQRDALVAWAASK